jgi:hypothetical protein
MLSLWILVALTAFALVFFIVWPMLIVAQRADAYADGITGAPWPPPASAGNLIDDDRLELLAKRFMAYDMRRRQRITFAQYLDHPELFDKIARIRQDKPVNIIRHPMHFPERTA